MKKNAKKHWNAPEKKKNNHSSLGHFSKEAATQKC